MFSLDLDAPEILRALEDFSEHILCQDPKFSFEQTFVTEAVGSQVDVEHGTSDATNNAEATGLEEYFMQPEFLFNLSDVHTLDSLKIEQPKIGKIHEAEIKILTPPVSPNMYSWETPALSIRSEPEKLVDNENVLDTFGTWNSNMRSDELFPDLSI
jgi:hypothetical protein